MVMHARKPQRINNDGYFEKHQAHPYQNSKYSSSKTNYGSGERYERIRDSPNGNYRSDSPDSQSPRDRDRAYQSKGSYLQKIREKERENRDYKMSREKYVSECRSPKDKRSRDSGKDSEHRTNHDRSSLDDKLTLHPIKVSSSSSQRDRKLLHNCQDKREDRTERVTRVGDWSEHISSSGKKYYYNCKTEVSQWEKPREWVERERERDRERDSGRFRKESQGSYGGRSGSGSTHDKHSSGRGGGRDKGGQQRHWTNNRTDELPAALGQSAEVHDPRRKHNDGDVQTTQQDMDISPGDSTPTSEMSYSQHTASTSRGGSGDCQGEVDTTGSGPVLLAQALPRLQPQPEPQASSGAPVSTPQPTTPAMVPPPVSAGATCNTPGPPSTVTIGSLPRILSQTCSSKELSMSEGMTLNHGKGLMVSRQGSESGAPEGNGLQPSEGPPTPTHSETQDCLDPRKSLASVTSPPASLSSLQGVAALRSTGPTITPSLANHYRDDLVNHVRGWPADILEKQAQKLSDDSFIAGSLQCTKVSADLKSARSIVRLTEIQATLQEQRILFLRQQIKMLEDMKAQNSFMSDDS